MLNKNLNLFLIFLDKLGCHVYLVHKNILQENFFCEDLIKNTSFKLTYWKKGKCFVFENTKTFTLLKTCSVSIPKLIMLRWAKKLRFKLFTPISLRLLNETSLMPSFKLVGSKHFDLYSLLWYITQLLLITQKVDTIYHDIVIHFFKKNYLLKQNDRFYLNRDFSNLSAFPPYRPSSCSLCSFSYNDFLNDS